MTAGTEQPRRGRPWARLTIPVILGGGLGFFAGVAATYQFGIILSAVVWGMVLLIALLLLLGGLQAMRRSAAAPHRDGSAQLWVAGALVGATIVGSALGPLVGPAYREPPPFDGTIDLALTDPPTTSSQPGVARCTRDGARVEIYGELPLEGGAFAVVELSFAGENASQPSLGLTIHRGRRDESTFYVQTGSSRVAATQRADAEAGHLEFSGIALDPTSPGADGAPPRISGELSWDCRSS